jgi:hypothetical protein
MKRITVELSEREIEILASSLDLVGEQYRDAVGAIPGTISALAVRLRGLL